MNNLAEVLPASFRDPAGFVYSIDGTVYRQVNKNYDAEYQAFMSSGLYDALVDQNLLLAHEEVGAEMAFTQTAARVLLPTQLEFISYPYEWSFNQLKDAAFLTLKVARCSLDNNMYLKDASAYNIQFHSGQPVFIDTFSFERYTVDVPWVAYRQFCQHFLAPLALMSKTDIRLNTLFKNYIDGIPLDLASKLLPFSANFSFSLALHIKLHAYSQRKHANTHQAGKVKRPVFSKNSFYGLLDSLYNAISKLTWAPKGTEWHDYYQSNNNYSDEALNHKERLVASYIQSSSAKTAWDLGANTGRFSRIAASKGLSVIAWDVDPACVESNYLENKQNNDTKVLPLLLDLTNPSPGIGWQHQERASLVDRGPADLIIALGLVHHLAIPNNVPLEKIAEFFSKLGSNLVIEFIPKEDSQVLKLLSTREDVFPDYNQQGFEQAFNRHYSIVEKEDIPESKRTLYRMRCIINPVVGRQS